MNREELIHGAVCQLVMVLVAFVLSLFFGLNAALSAAAGGLCVAIPNLLVVMNLLISDLTKRPIKPLLLVAVEFLKILATCMLLGLTAVLYSGLVWPALIFGVISAAFSVFLLLIFNH